MVIRTKIQRGLTMACMGLLFLYAPGAGAYTIDVGFLALQNQLGAATPTGADVRVTQVEAAINEPGGGAPPVYMPDPTDFQFIGKIITPFDGNPSGAFSGHAASVGGLFYGNTASVAPGITQIESFEANGWLNSLYQSTPGPGFGSATISQSRVANHSWVGGGGIPSDDGTVLRLVDRQVHLNEYVQVVAAPANNLSPLLGSAYNVITVGRTDGVHDLGSHAIPGDGIYTGGRAKPDLVAPHNSTSGATPIVAAAAALLVQTGHEGELTLSHGSTTLAGIGTIYNAERSETVKAALMAGADRATANTSTTADITDYRSAGHQTANGLDTRYGAGQVNVLNSYRIIAGGEQSGHIGQYGFDYNSAFGGLGGSSRTVTYSFLAGKDLTLYASLVWNLEVADNALLTATPLRNLDLHLIDTTNQSVVAMSASLVDNTENVWATLLSGSSYELRVTTSETANFSSDYAIAWRMEPSPVPLPPAAWLFASGLAAVARLVRRDAKDPSITEG